MSATVTVIEDDPEVLATCVEALTQGGLTARGYTSARAALFAAEQGGLGAIVLIDLHLTGESSFDTIHRLRAIAPSALFVAFTGHAGDEWLFSALTAGCVGYVLKTDVTLPIAEAVRQAIAGGAPMSPGIARRVLERWHAPVAPDGATLSPRELAVLKELADGYRYDQVAVRLEISLSTVRSHVQRIYAKLGVNTKSEATARAVRMGLIR